MSHLRPESARVNGHSLPGVAEVAVVGRPDAKWGEVPVAFLIQRPGAYLTIEDVREGCRKNLRSYQCVKEVRFEDTLPENATGKILKRSLRDQFE